MIHDDVTVDPVIVVMSLLMMIMMMDYKLIKGSMMMSLKIM